MNAIITLRSLLLFIFLSSTSFLSAQIYNDENDYSFPESEYCFAGKVCLNNNDTITGLVSLNHRKQQNYFTKIKDGVNTYSISNDEISSIVLHQKIEESTIKTIFEKINESPKFYRVLGVGAVTLYDDSVRPFTDHFSGELFIKQADKVRSIYNFWSSGPKQDLINYINDRDRKSFNRGDFKSVRELVDYAVQ